MRRHQVDGLGTQWRGRWDILRVHGGCGAVRDAVASLIYAMDNDDRSVGSWATLEHVLHIWAVVSPRCGR